MESFGTMTLPGYRFEAHAAKMWRFHFDGDEEERSGWGLNIAAGSPVDEPDSEECKGLFSDGICLYAEDEPIPLPEASDLTGVEFYLKEPYHPETGEVYFTFWSTECRDVSEVRIRFLERQADRYRVELSALVHQVFGQPTELRYVGWVEVVGEQSAGGATQGAVPNR
jgi:hypothetical protein